MNINPTDYLPTDGVSLADGDIETLAERLAVPVSPSFHRDVQRAVSGFVEDTVFGLSGCTVSRVAQRIAHDAGEALRLMFGAVEGKLSAAETYWVLFLLDFLGAGLINVERLTESRIGDLYAWMALAQQWKQSPRRRGRPKDESLITFVERLVLTAERAGYDVLKFPAWRAKTDSSLLPPLAQFVDIAFAMAILRARAIHDRSEACDQHNAIGARLDELKNLSERSIADRVAAIVKARAAPAATRVTRLSAHN